MFITHHFYENSFSGANSYVKVFDTIKEAKEDMYYSIYACVSRCEEKDMDEMVKILKERDSDHSIEETIGEFTIQCDDTSYNLFDNYKEDIYHFAILDTDDKERGRSSEF